MGIDVWFYAFSVDIPLSSKWSNELESLSLGSITEVTNKINLSLPMVTWSDATTGSIESKELFISIDIFPYEEEPEEVSGLCFEIHQDDRNAWSLISKLCKENNWYAYEPNVLDEFIDINNPEKYY